MQCWPNPLYFVQNMSLSCSLLNSDFVVFFAKFWHKHCDLLQWQFVSVAGTAFQNAAIKWLISVQKTTKNLKVTKEPQNLPMLWDSLLFEDTLSAQQLRSAMRAFLRLLLETPIGSVKCEWMIIIVRKSVLSHVPERLLWLVGWYVHLFVFDRCNYVDSPSP